MRVLSVLALATLSSTALAAVCPITDGEAFGEGAALFTGNTANFVDDFTPSCAAGTPGSGDFEIEFTAPIAGLYFFDTFGSGFDTSLSQIDLGDCATSIQCNDDSGGLQSQISIELAPGETALIAIDGYGGGTGDFIFNATWTPPTPPPTCVVDANLGSFVGPFAAAGVTCGAANNQGLATCGGGQESEDLMFSWTAPFDGTFTFDTEGSSYDTALTVRDTACNELACDDDGGTGLLSSIAFDAAGGVTYNIVVDGFGSGACGDFVLNIADGTCIDTDGDGVCDPNDICNGDDASGDSDGDGTCDNIDFTLDTPAPTAGQQLTLGAANAPAGAQVFFLATGRGTGAGPCHPSGAVCTDLLQPTILGSRTAGPAGGAGITITVPPSLSGRTGYFQAVWFDGTTGDTTEVDVAAIQ